MKIIHLGQNDAAICILFVISLISILIINGHVLALGNGTSSLSSSPTISESLEFYMLTSAGIFILVQSFIHTISDYIFSHGTTSILHILHTGIVIIVLLLLTCVTIYGIIYNDCGTVLSCYQIRFIFLLNIIFLYLNQIKHNLHISR